MDLGEEPYLALFVLQEGAVVIRPFVRNVLRPDPYADASSQAPGLGVEGREFRLVRLITAKGPRNWGQPAAGGHETALREARSSRDP